MFKRGRSLAFLAVFLVLSFAAPHAGAVTLQTIQGIVADPLGRPLEGVLVSDGQGRFDLTDSTGYYIIEESSISTYTVRASRTGLNAQVRVVTPTDSLGRIDFTPATGKALTYVVSSSLDAGSGTFNSLPHTLLITTFTYAPPNPGCVVFTDVATGGTASLSYQSQGTDGRFRWTGSFTVSAPRADGNYQWSVKQTDCSGKQLTTSPSPTYNYILDSVSPRFAATLPSNGANMARATAPLRAIVSELGSGVNPSATTITVTDLDTSEVRSLAIAQFSPATGIIQTVATSFVAGHRYRANFGVQDYAGNSSSIESEFLAMRWTVNSLPEITITHGEPRKVSENLTRGEATWEFPEVVIKGESYEVDVSRTNSAGWGAIPAFVDLANAVVNYNIAGQAAPQPPRVSSVAPGWHDDVVLAQQVALIGPAASFSNTPVRTGPGAAPLGSLLVTLPLVAESPSIDLGDVLVSPLEPGNIVQDNPCYPGQCPPPSPPCQPASSCLSSVPNYSSDYLVAYISDDEVNVLVDAIEKGETATHCKQVEADVAAYAECNAHAPVGLALGLALLPDSGNPSGGDSWVESSQLVSWYAGLGRRPTPGEMPQRISDAMQNAGTITAASNWSSAVCQYAHCSPAESVSGWNDYDTMAGDPDECTNDCDPVEGTYAYTEKCVDRNGNAVSPQDRKKCKQSGYLTISEWHKTAEPARHYIYAGWYRTRGTPDGLGEDLAARWAGSDEASSFLYNQHSFEYYVGARTLRVVNPSQTNSCREKAWTEVLDRTNLGSRYNSTTNLYEFYDPKRAGWYSTIISKKRYQSNQALGMGQMFTYLQRWWTPGTCKSGSGDTLDVHLESRSVSTSISFVADERRGSGPYFENNQGMIGTWLVHHVGPSAGKVLACTLGTAYVAYAGSAAAADFWMAVFRCDDLNEKSWEMGHAAAMRY